MKNDSDRRILDKILHSASLENKDVLEIGCGNGRITSLLAGKPKHLIAIEPDPEKVKEARETISGVDFRKGSGENLEFADGCFDLVIFTLSLHHQNSETAIGEAVRVLRRNGRVLIIEPVNEGEIEQLFTLLRDETHEVVLAQKAINDSDLYLESSEKFTAEWIFDDKDDLLQSVFRHYGIPFDADIAIRIADFLGQTSGNIPIVLHDSMVFQVLLKAELTALESSDIRHP